MFIEKCFLAAGETIDSVFMPVSGSFPCCVVGHGGCCGGRSDQC